MDIYSHYIYLQQSSHQHLPNNLQHILPNPQSLHQIPIHPPKPRPQELAYSAHKPRRTPRKLIPQPHAPNLPEPLLQLIDQPRLRPAIIGTNDLLIDTAGEEEEERDDEAGAVFALRAMHEDRARVRLGQRGEDLAQLGGAVLEGVEGEADQPARAHGVRADEVHGGGAVAEGC
jgi:hypothetical protein